MSTTGPGAVESEMHEVVAQVNNAHDMVKPIPLSLDHILGTAPIIDSTQSIAVNWAPFLDKVKLFAELMDRVSEVRH